MNSIATANPGLQVSARTENCVIIAELAGVLDVASAPELRERLLTLLRPASSRLVIDLSRVSFCDANGLAVLMGTARRARLLGGFLRLAAAPPEVSQVLLSTGLDRYLLVFPTVSLAASASSTPVQRDRWDHSGRPPGQVRVSRPAGQVGPA